MTPLFSIITVCRNAAGNLSSTIDSVEAQTFRDFEHIIIDGASTDNTHEVLSAAKAPHRIIISESDNGIYDAMNKGLGQAKGDYVIFMNSGDRFHGSDALQCYADAITANNRPGIIYGQTELIDAHGNFIGARHLTAPANLTASDFAQGMLVCHQSMAVLRRITHLYDTRYRFSADYDWVIKCLRHSHANIYTGRVMCDYLSEGVTTANRRKSLIERFRIMCRYYGTVPTVFRHFRFLYRFIRHKSQ